MKKTRILIALAALLALAACADGGSNGDAASATPTSSLTIESTAVAESTVAAPVSPAPNEPPGPFPVAAFAAIGEEPLRQDVAARFQTVLDKMANGGGMSATVMTADGTWTGTAGTADGVRGIQVDDQFSIASVTKSIVAAQVMQLVEAGEISLDDPADDHLPPELGIDTNDATIRNLLSHRTGFRDPFEVIYDTLATERLRQWTLLEVLEVTGEAMWNSASSFSYSDTNYWILGQIVEHVRERPLAEVLRDGVLAIDGVERLVYQPDEPPSAPMAMPAGESTDALALGGGYLSSLAGVTSAGPAGAMASDSPSLARWWRAFCAGEIVSSVSLTEMATPVDAPGDLHYGLGLFDPEQGEGVAVGHAGVDFGYNSWAACLPEEGAVVVVLANREFGDTRGMASPLLDALRSE